MHVKGKMMAFCGLLSGAFDRMYVAWKRHRDEHTVSSGSSFIFRGDCHPGIRDESGRGFLCSGRPAGIFDCSKQVLCLLFCGDGTLYRDNRGGMEISGAICQHSAPVPFLGG